MSSFFGPKQVYADSIQKNAIVMIRNLKTEEIKCKVEYKLCGHLESCSPETVEKTELSSTLLNPTTKVVWKVTIPPRGSSEILFKYSVREAQK